MKAAWEFMANMVEIYEQLEFIGQTAEIIEKEMKALIESEGFKDLPEDVRMKIQLNSGRANAIKHTVVYQLGTPLDTCGKCGGCDMPPEGEPQDIIKE